MPTDRLARFTLLPELVLTAMHEQRDKAILEVRKESAFEVCPRCATKSQSIYDHRKVQVRDAPIRGKRVILVIEKRRFQCLPCRRPFTEPVGGISKGERTTQRYKRHLLWACENFADLKSVRRHLDCSDGFVHRALYEQLERKAKERRYPWPRVIGLDEHRFKRHPVKGHPIFASIVVDHVNKRVFDLVEGRSNDELNAALREIPGRDKVQRVTIDLSTSYRRFVRGFFPHAVIVADKFHVLRLLTPALNKRRKQIAGDRRKNPIGRLLLKNARSLDFFHRAAVYRWLEQHPDIGELYHYKEALQSLYRVKGYERARRALIALTTDMAQSQLPEVKTLRRTLMAWRNEILEYFKTPLTNGRVEGYNGKAKLIMRRAYGYRSFKNYRLRVLNGCA